MSTVRFTAVVMDVKRAAGCRRVFGSNQAPVRYPFPHQAADGKGLAYALDLGAMTEEERLRLAAELSERPVASAADLAEIVAELDREGLDIPAEDVVVIVWGCTGAAGAGGARENPQP